MYYDRRMAYRLEQLGNPGCAKLWAPLWSAAPWQSRRLVSARVLSLVEVVLSGVFDLFDLAGDCAGSSWSQTAGGIDALNESNVAEHAERGFLSCLK